MLFTEESENEASVFYRETSTRSKFPKRPHFVKNRDKEPNGGWGLDEGCGFPHTTTWTFLVFGAFEPKT